MLSIPIKVFLRSLLSSPNEVLFAAGTLHWNTGSSVRSITSSHNTPRIYHMSEELFFFQLSQYLMQHYFVT